MSATVLQLPARTTLGGSDAAAAAGVDPYRSRVMLWLEKTGRVERQESEAMRWGTLLEPLVKGELRERGYEVAEQVGSWEARDERRPWLVGHPDGLVAGEPPLLLEVKTTNQWAHRANGELPVGYAAQIQTYLHLTGMERCLFAVLVAGQRLEVSTVDRDERAVALLLERMEEFVGYVTRDEPPPPDGTESARDAILALHPTHTPGKRYRLTGAEWKAARELRERREQRDAIDAQVRELENALKLAAGDAETILTPHDTTFATWKTVTTHRLDTKTLRERLPHIYEQYATETTSRRFTLA